MRINTVVFLYYSRLVQSYFNKSLDQKKITTPSKRLQKGPKKRYSPSLFNRYITVFVLIKSMETEGDSRVHFSEVSDPWSSSRHVAVLQALDAVEKVRAVFRVFICHTIATRLDSCM